MMKKNQNWKHIYFFSPQNAWLSLNFNDGLTFYDPMAIFNCQWEQKLGRWQVSRDGRFDFRTDFNIRIVSDLTWFDMIWFPCLLKIAVATLWSTFYQFIGQHFTSSWFNISPSHGWLSILTGHGSTFYHVMIQCVQVCWSAAAPNVRTRFHQRVLTFSFAPWFGGILNQIFNKSVVDICCYRCSGCKLFDTIQSDSWFDQLK